MLYNIITISVELFLIGFLTSVIAYYGISKNRSQHYVVELILATLGSFLGTLAEAWIRSFTELPLVFHIFFQFVLPIIGSVVVLFFYRLTKNPED